MPLAILIPIMVLWGVFAETHSAKFDTFHEDLIASAYAAREFVTQEYPHYDPIVLEFTTEGPNTFSKLPSEDKGAVIVNLASYNEYDYYGSLEAIQHTVFHEFGHISGFISEVGANSYAKGMMNRFKNLQESTEDNKDHIL